MLNTLWLTPLIPLASFIVLALFGGRLSRHWVAGIAAGGIAVVALLAWLIGADFYQLAPEQRNLTQSLGNWFTAGPLRVPFTLRLDELSMVMLLIVSSVAFLIHLFSTEFMATERDYSRYFAYLNLFVAAMLVLVLADNLLLLFLGWEGVGLCSYLLIGYWHQNPANGYAARKAFVVTRVGDVALLLGIFLLFQELGTLDIQPMLQSATEAWAPGSYSAWLACLLILGGALGKSAQLPLQVWLPDAMAGPSPVSALIHAATMVTAGVYLIARLHPLYLLSPEAQQMVAFIGAATLLIAGFSALAQRDLKGILAYSTISQIGYMFMALGVGAWSAALFHLMTHAFFKALLFLSAGLVIAHMHDEHDIFHMGGLRRVMPLTYAAFLTGAASLAALPLITAGFYSKDLILMATLDAPFWSLGLFIAGLTGAFVTAVYSFRAVFVVFWGSTKIQRREAFGWKVQLPLLLLLGLSILGALIPLPLAEVFPAHEEAEHAFWPQLLAAAVPLLGLALALVLYGRRRGREPKRFERGGLYSLWRKGWGFDDLYQAVLAGPLTTFARFNRHDLVEGLVRTVVAIHKGLNSALASLQTGRIRHYATGMVAGVLLIVSLGVLL